jgi:Mycobacterium membrane protein/Protein of unknown function (DUF732)
MRWKLLAAAAAVVCMAGCGSGAKAAAPRASADATANPSPASSDTGAFAGTADADYLSVAQPILPDENTTSLIKTGKLICEAFAIRDSYNDVTDVMSDLNLDTSSEASLIHASVLAYCPTQADAEAAATAAPAPSDEVSGFVGVTAPPTDTRVTYKITSNSSTALVTYIDDGSIEQASGAALPWSKKVEPGTFASVSAQDENGDTITCEIIASDGSVLSKHTSTGAYAIASCEAPR